MVVQQQEQEKSQQLKPAAPGRAYQLCRKHQLPAKQQEEQKHQQHWE